MIKTGRKLITFFLFVSAAINGQMVKDSDVLSRIIEVDSAGQRCIIDRGLVDGLIPGTSGLIYENRGNESIADIEWAMAIARGQVAQIDSYQTVLYLTDIKSPVKIGDCFSGSYETEAETINRPLYRLAAYDINFTDLDDDKPLFTYAALRRDRDGRQTRKAIDRLVAEIKSHADLAADVHEGLIRGGMFDGRTLTEAFAEVTRDQVETFLEFVYYFPGKYLLNTYHLVDVYGTWIINATPTAEDKKTQDRAAGMLKEVQTMVDAGQYEQAMTRVQEALRIKPDYDLARKYLEKLDDILRNLRILAVDSENVNARIILGRGLYYFNHEAEAVEQFRAALRMGFTADDVYLYLGYALTSLGQYREAMTAFQTVLNHNPRNKNALKWLRFASAKHLLGQTDDAESHIAIGGIKYDEGNYDEAIQEYEKILQQDPGSERVRQLIRRAQRRRDAADFLRWARENWAEHNYEKARERFLQAYEACAEAGDTTGMIEVLETEGLALKESQRYREARDVLKTIISLQPAYLDAYVEIGRVYSNMEQKDSALIWLQKALTIDSLSAWTHNIYGFLLSALGRYQEALVHLRRAAELDTTYAYPHYHIGVTYVRMGMYPQAIAAFRKELTIDPDDRDARDELSYLRVLQICDSLLAAGSAAEKIPLRQARALYNLGRYELAHKAAQEAVKRMPDNAEAWRYLGYILCQSRRYQEAETALRRAADLAPENTNVLNWLKYSRARALLAQNPEHPEGLFLQGESDLYDSSYEDAISNFTKALIAGYDSSLIRGKIAMAEKGLKAQRLKEKGDYFYNHGDYESATPDYEQALIIYRELNNRSDESWLNYLLGWCYFNANEYDKAFASFNAGGKIGAEIGDPYKRGPFLSNLGNYYLTAAGDFDKARDHFQQALDWYREIDDFDGQFRALFQIASLHSQLGEYRAAEEVYQEILAIHESLADDKGTGAVYNNLAGIYLNQDDYSTAIPYSQKALEIGQRRKDAVIEMNALSNLASAYNDLGDTTRALFYGREYLKTATGFGSDWARASANNQIGLVYYNIIRDYRQALGYFEKCRAIGQILGNKMLEGVGASNVGRCFAQLGDYKKAVEFQQRGLDLVRAAKSRYAETQGLKEFGQTYLSMKKIDQARISFQQGLTAARQMSMPGIEWECLYYLGQIHEIRNQPDSAIIYYQTAAKVLLGIRQRIMQEEAEKGFMAYGEKQDVYRRLIELLIKQGRPDEAIEYLEQSKSKMIQESFGNLKPQVNDEKINQDLARIDDARFKKEALEKQLQEEKAKPLPEQNMVRIENISTTLAQTESEFNKLMFELQTTNENIFNFITINPFSLGDVQEGLPEEAVLLEYFLTADRLYIFVIQRGRKFRVEEVKVGSQELEALVDYYLGLIKNIDTKADEDLMTSGRKLYDYLIRPVAAEITPKNVVIIVPFGILYYLPFHALIRNDDKTGGEYFIQWKKIVYLTSSTWLDIMKKMKTRKVESLFAYADPDGSLPGAQQEVKVLKDSIFTRAEVFTLSEATKNRFLSEAKNFNIVHLATHGYLEPDPLKSYILMAGPDDRLTLLDIAGYTALRDNTFLVFLSACETAVEKGRSNGRELMSLAKAFTTAGPPSLIATLWKIPDISTSQLVTIFYNELKKKKAVADALRDAQLAVIANEKYRHPYYWAGFLLFGDYR